MLTLHTKNYTHKGKRECNEDAIYPNKDKGSNLYLICDGVGGYKYGEYASKKAIEFFSRKHKCISKPNEQDIHHIIYQLQINFNEEKKQNPEMGKMATTIAGISFTDNQAILFWAGDTHIYHFNNGKLKTESRDHTYVNKLIEHNIITPEEALEHPQKTVIVKAINGNEEISAEVIRVQDINVGDFFLIASDGVLEATPKNDLVSYFDPNNNFNQIYHKIKSDCLEHSRDNFSFYLIKVINLG